MVKNDNQYFELINACNKQIHISVNGSDTIAVLKENGKVVKKAEAKCNPADEFNFETGVKLAFDRLFEKEKKEPKFKVGDLVKVTNSHMFVYKGTIGEVVAIEDNDTLKIKEVTLGSTLYIDKKYAEKVAKPAPTFKIGDRVKE